MKYSTKLARGQLVRRYKRFLADVRLEDGSTITIHCPNTGSMKNCADPGDEVFFSTSDNLKRKYAHTWELSRTSRGHYIGVNTGRANELIRGALEQGVISELAGYRQMRAEVQYGNENSRIDFLLTNHPVAPDCYVEVKSVTLLESPISHGKGYFPDAISTRGARHLRELSEVVGQGARGVLCFCVQHSGIRSVMPADHIDEVYGEALRKAAAAGVEMIAYKARMSASSISISGPVPVILP